MPGNTKIRRKIPLSEREQQVFRLVVEGKSAKDIAELLFVSPKTIEKHRSNVMKTWCT